MPEGRGDDVMESQIGSAPESGTVRPRLCGGYETDRRVAGCGTFPQKSCYTDVHILNRRFSFF